MFHLPAHRYRCVCCLTGADGPVSEATQRAVHDRLGFDVLLGHRAWRSVGDDSGLELLHYENLDRHLAVGYAQLAAGAAHHDFRSADGTSLAENYASSEVAARQGEIGLNLAVYSRG